MTATVLTAPMVASSLIPSVTVAIAVDTGAVVAASSGTITEGVYMMDNMVRNGSTNEGRINLHTECNVEALIGFQVLPIDGAGQSGDSVKITSFAMEGGDDVFTGAGHPRCVKKPPAGLKPGAYWIGQAMAAGTQTYEIQIEVTVGVLQPVKYYVTWNAELTAS